jgi:protoporphyrinogen oxidase
VVTNGRLAGVATAQGSFPADAVIATPALPIINTLAGSQLPRSYTENFKKIIYLANVCLVLELERPLSEYYWLNVTDPDFPFVGLIEHTNFEPPETYGGRHIVYLSKYLPETSALFNLGDRELYEFSLPHLKRLFPDFKPAWIRAYHVWRARCAQPVVDCRYPRHIPAARTPLAGFYIATMAQIYPEDRGTNYAVREGRRIGALVSEDLKSRETGG